MLLGDINVDGNYVGMKRLTENKEAWGASALHGPAE